MALTQVRSSSQNDPASCPSLDTWRTDSNECEQAARLVGFANLVLEEENDAGEAKKRDYEDAQCSKASRSDKTAFTELCAVASRSNTNALQATLVVAQTLCKQNRAQDASTPTEQKPSFAWTIMQEPGTSGLNEQLNHLPPQKKPESKKRAAPGANGRHLYKRMMYKKNGDGPIIVPRAYQCGYCSARKMSTSDSTDGQIRIRCDCGGRWADGKSRMHASWIPLDSDGLPMSAKKRKELGRANLKPPKFSGIIFVDETTKIQGECKACRQSKPHNSEAKPTGIQSMPGQGMSHMQEQGLVHMHTQGHMLTQAPVQMSNQVPNEMQEQGRANHIPTQAPVHMPTQAPVHMPTQAPVQMSNQAPVHMQEPVPNHMPTQAPVQMLEQRPVSYGMPLQ